MVKRVGFAMTKRLAGKSAIVTGSGQGIGRAVAISFAREGAGVTVVDIDGDKAAAVAAEITADGGNANPVAVDVADAHGAQEMTARATEAFGHVDILVNNAGITRPAMLHKMTDEQWLQVITVNLTGVFYCIRAVAPRMMERESGRIINVTSGAGLQGTIGQINYSAAKAGVVAITKSAARELAPFGILVNAVAPSAATAMTEKIRTDSKFREGQLQRMLLKRWPEPEEMAPYFVFLASDECSYTTGHVLLANGGTVMA